MMYLASGMTLEAEASVAVAHTATVVDDLYQRTARIFHHQVNLCGASVHRVLQQLLHGAGRTVHHLAGRYLVGHTIRQYVDNIHDLVYSI